MPRLHLKLLGTFGAWLDEARAVQIPLKKARLLLALLALSPSRGLSRERITELLWSDRSEAQARQSLRQTLAAIRRALGDAHSEILQADAEAIGFAKDAVDSDVSLLLGISSGSPLAEVERAVTAYEGDLLEGLSVRDPVAQDWLADRRAELRAAMMERLIWLLQAHTRAQHYEDMERIASHMLGLDPLAEEAHQALIRAHLARGERSLALQQYRHCRELLARELGVEPMPETKRLLESVNQERPVGSPYRPESRGRSPQSAAVPSARRHNLARQVTSLIGRKAEIDEVTDRLRRYGLVTLTGAGGSGKTRLAIEAGLRSIDIYADGVWFIELAPVENSEFVAETICKTIGIPVENGRSAAESTVAHLQHRELLLILDNCEHLISGAAAISEKIRQACPSVAILATSRESLAVAGESTYHVPTLTFPPEAETITPACALTYSSVQLFVERASAVIGGFSLNEANAPAVCSICKQLDGIPLAIELAVAQLKMMGPEWLAKNLHDVFRSARKARREALSRHQTLWTLLDWSYDLLNEREQALLRRLSVFTGGCTLRSAAWVGSGDPIPEDEVFDLLSCLVEKSLVVSDLSRAEPRYRLLETTRQYAFEKLRERRERGRRRRLAEYLVQMFREADDSWPTTPTDNWLGQHGPELDNLRASLDWAFGPEGDSVLGVELASHSIRLWDELALFGERARWSEIALAQADEGTRPAIMARLWLSRTSNSAHGDRSSFKPAQEAVELYRMIGDPVGLGEALTKAGAAVLTVGTVAEALPHLDGALAILDPLGPTKPLANCLRSKGVAAYFKGDIGAARIFIARSATVAKSVGDLRGAANAQIALAELEFRVGEVEAAIAEVRRMLSSRDHNQRQAALGHGNLAAYLLSADRMEEARQAALESLRQARALRWPAAIVRAGEHLALIAALTGRSDAAARLLGYSTAFYAEGSASREFTEQVTYERLTNELANHLSPDRLGVLMAEGASWSEDQAGEAAAQAGQDSATGHDAGL